MSETAQRDTDAAATDAHEGQGLSRALVVLLAVAVGTAVANRFYVEPLLGVIARSFFISQTAAGLLVTCAQVGYLIGLALLVPLGDVLERRRLTTILMLAAGAAAAACAVGSSLAVFAVTLAALALFAVCAQILIPLAAMLAAPEERGQVVGIVTSGLLVGILAARAVSGVAAGVGGFRLIFALAAAAMVVLALLLRRALPRVAPTEPSSYRSLLRSVLKLISAEPILRQRTALGFLQMAGFSVLWTPSAFLLTGAPYHYSTAIIGLFGLVGVAGALTAPIAGRLGDRGHGRLAVTVSLTALLASWGLLALGGTSLIALIAGIAGLDAGVQGAHVNHQSTIFAMHPEARNRLNTAYMVAFFLGGVLGSLLAATVYGAAGWTANCLVGAALAGAALTVWATTERSMSPTARTRQGETRPLASPTRPCSSPEAAPGSVRRSPRPSREKAPPPSSPAAHPNR